MLIDSHTHLDFPQFKKDREKVIQRIKQVKIRVINVGSHRKACQDSVDLAQKHDFIYAAVGLHPHDAEKVKDINELVNFLRQLTKKPKVVAIGECGLDYYPVDQGKFRKEITPKLKEKQQKVFQAQLKLAEELKLPVIVHNRDAHQDVLQLIKAHNLTGTFHCFSGDKDFLKQVLGLGFYIGFCGNLTFKNAPELQALAKLTPLNRLLIETDCPYLSPEPLRGTRNEPVNVKIIAEYLAKLKNTSFAKVAQITTKNAQNLFQMI
ncbi:MAG: TatD family hydrolase [Candidatus Marinimicrobia bacterium]|nr:TatD family hydrolase [Candidatus Neomarinimicrobiota bacterium]